MSSPTISTPTIPTPGPTISQPTTASIAPNSFDEWMRKNAEVVATKDDEIYVEHPKLPLIAAGRACEHLQAAIAIGKQYLPMDKFSTTNAIELARFIYEIESDMTDELVTEEEDDDDDDSHGSGSTNNRAGGVATR